MSCGPVFSARLLYPRYWLMWFAIMLFLPIAWLPVSLRHRLGRFAGRLIYKNNNKRRTIVLHNLSVAQPNLSEQVRQEKALEVLQWYGCAMIDYSVLLFRPKHYVQYASSFKGLSKIKKAVEEGRNVIVLLTHSVWLDFAPAMLSMHFELYGSYKPLSNRLLDWLLQRLRCRYVSFVVPREEGMMRLVRSLQKGRVLIFLPDEDLGEQQSDFAPFFGRNKATLNTPARIAKIKKAVCFPCYTYFDAATNKYCTVLGESLAPFPAKSAEESAGVLNKGLEQVIMSAPLQYMWQLKYYRSTALGDRVLY